MLVGGLWFKSHVHVNGFYRGVVPREVKRVLVWFLIDASLIKGM